MNWTRIFWATVGGLALVTLVGGCGCAPGDHCVSNGYDGPWTYYGYDVQHIPQIGK
jgi:hypothetical protein